MKQKALKPGRVFVLGPRRALRGAKAERLILDLKARLLPDRMTWPEVLLLAAQGVAWLAGRALAVVIAALLFWALFIDPEIVAEQKQAEWQARMERVDSYADYLTDRVRQRYGADRYDRQGTRY